MTKVFIPTSICIFLVLISCNPKSNQGIYNSKAVELNNKAVEFMTTQKLDSALIYLNEAIKVDTTYYVAYSNKSSVYCSLKNFNDALLATEMAIKVKPDLAEGWTFAGMLNDKLGDSINALKYYKKSIELFDERISNPAKLKYLEANKVNRAISYILIGQEETGRNEIKKIMDVNHSAKSLESYLKLSKKQYLSQVFQNY